MRMLRQACQAYGLLGKGILMKKFIKKAAGIFIMLPLMMMFLNIPASVISHAAVSAVWPLDEEFSDITTYFDARRNDGDNSAYHNAIDIPADYCANIYAAYSGECVSAGWMDDYGYLIILYHADIDKYTFYAHCTSTAVSSGASVTAGQIIGYVGSTGTASGNHLHFGICDDLLAGWPTVTYYDPLTYFTYNTVSNPSNNDCGCDVSYGGIYTTNGVSTYLNIRSGHGSEFDAIGEIPPGAEFTVIKADGEWAHVEYNGISGFCHMDYIKKIADIKSEMTLTGVSVPSGKLAEGSAFSLTGRIDSALKINKVWGGVYGADGETAVMTTEDSPTGTEYDFTGKFDGEMHFNRLTAGTYVYCVQAEDSSGAIYTLINSVFYVGDGKNENDGDINDDGEVNISDAVILSGFLINGDNFTLDKYIRADLNKDSAVDVYDMIFMRSYIVA